MARNLSQDTILLVFGDNGMTDSGDHGGSFPEATNSRLRNITKPIPNINKPILNPIRPDMHRIRRAFGKTP